MLPQGISSHHFKTTSKVNHLYNNKSSILPTFLCLFLSLTVSLLFSVYLSPSLPSSPLLPPLSLPQESRSLLLEAVHLSVRESFSLGVKLVRGAYMDKERKLANQEARTDPIHQSWEHTNNRSANKLYNLGNLIDRLCYKLKQIEQAATETVV